MKIQFFLATAFFGIHLYGMESVPVAENWAMSDTMLELFKKVLPLRTLTAFACTDKSLYKEFNTEYWIQKFIDAGLRDNYIRVNRTILQLCQTALPQLVSTSQRRPTIFFSSRSSSEKATMEPIPMYVGRFTDYFSNRYADVDYIERMTRPYNSFLMQASNSLNIQLILALVEKGADVTLDSPSDFYSPTPISRVIQSRVVCSNQLGRLNHEQETIRCLVDLGADIHYVEPRHGWNYLFYAIHYEKWQLIPLLLKKYGINPNHKDNDLRNPLCYALSRLNVRPDDAKNAVIAPENAVVALMMAGSDPFAKDVHEKSPFGYARRYNKKYPGYLATLEEYCKGDEAWYSEHQRIPY
jgi:hypothetical protein